MDMDALSSPSFLSKGRTFLIFSLHSFLAE